MKMGHRYIRLIGGVLLFVGVLIGMVAGTHSYDWSGRSAAEHVGANVLTRVSSPSSSLRLDSMEVESALSTRLRLAAEGDVAATEPGWGPGTPAAGQPPGEPTIAEILKGKLGSIQRAPLPSGSPGWSDITNMTLSEIRAGAQENLPGYRTILKVLTDSRFNK